MAIVVNLVYTHLIRGIEDSVLIRIKPLKIGGSGGAIYLPYLVLYYTAWSTQKGMSTLQGLGAYSA